MEKKHKILIIDDDAEAIFVINQMLLKSNNPYDILNAFSAEAALPIIKNDAPDLIITDWEMPNMTGVELIQTLKNDPLTACIPVIVCTGKMKETADLFLAFQTGAIDYLRKPIDEFELIGRINATIRFAETYKQLMNERERFFEQEKQNQQEKLELIGNELSNRVLLMNKYGTLIKKINDLLNKIPNCTNSRICKLYLDEVIQHVQTFKMNVKWEELFLTFEQTYPVFFTKMLQKYPDLTKTELKISALLKLKHTTKEISAITGQTVRAVEMTRFRLRKKMGLKTEDNIENYL